MNTTCGTLGLRFPTAARAAQIFLLFMAVTTFSLSTTAQINIDSTFNANVTEGKVENQAVAVQPDGKILVGGGFSFANGVEKNVLTRLNPDGTLDTTFNPNGLGPNSSVLEIVLQSDGKILIGGIFGTYNGVPKAGLARLNSDGTLDNTFNPGGAGTPGIVRSIAIQPDGRILVAGSNIAAYNGVTKFTVFRVNPDGSLDASFTSPFTSAQFVENVELQSDGKIVAAGNFSLGASPNVRRDIIRMNPDGSLDTTFNPGGIGGDNNGIFALYVQTDGKILIGGAFLTYNDTSRPKVARLNADGTLDNNFVTNFPPVLNGAEYFAVQPDGKVLVAGAFGSADAMNVLFRLNTNGSTDNTFAANTADKLGYTLALQADGKILLGGFFNVFNNQPRTNLVRLNSNGTLDAPFNPLFVGFGYPATMALQADNKIVIGGNFNTVNGTARNNVARLNADGTLDTSFAAGLTGTQPDPFNSSNILNVVTIQPDGKILIGGAFGGYNNVARRGIARLNLDGSLDNSFSATGLFTSGITTVQDVLVLPDGKIIIGGSFGLTPTTNQPIIRLNADGSPTTAMPALPNGVIQKLALQPDGKILVAGSFTTYGGQSRNRIARINADGTLDTNFNPGTGANAVVTNIALQADGKIIIMGSFTTYNDVAAGRIARLNADGSLDTSFNAGGIGASSTVESVTFLPDGKFMVGGRFAAFNNVAHSRLVRLNADGSLDLTFISGFDNDPRFFVRRTLLQPNGRLLVSGLIKSYNGMLHNGIARVLLASQQTQAASNGQIVFASIRDADDEIYKMNQDGSNQTRLTNALSDDFDPQWSPDGTKIVFSSGRDGTQEIYMMNADGSSQTRITNNSFFDMEPTWSPDGTQIAFQSIRGNNRDIYVINANGTNERRLTFDGQLNSYPRWSPNGASIAFISNRDGNPEIYTMSSLDGGNLTRLTNNTAFDFSPDWSPDGTKIAFSTNRDGGNLEIYTMTSGGTSPTRITNNSVDDDLPSWSPDGTKITLTRSLDNNTNSEIFTINASNGGNEVRLTNVPELDYSSDWQPRFAAPRTAFDFDGDGRADIAVFRPSDGVWYLLRSTAGFTGTQFGISSDKIAPADYDGDGKTDLTVFRDGNWYRLNSSNGAFIAVQFGAAGDTPVPGDYDGDGKADLAVFRQGVWYFINSSNNQFRALQFGISSDKPVAADYDGDGKTDIAVYRSGNWYSLRSSDGNFTAVQFGISSDRPVPADYDGDGKADQAVFRNGEWYLLRSTAGFTGFQFGIASDIPSPADFDGDGKADATVFRSGNWYRVNSSNNQFVAVQFGVNNDRPVSSAFVP